MLKSFLVLNIFLSGSVAVAGGPKLPAMIAPDLWPMPIESAADFDDFSRANIFVFLSVLQSINDGTVSISDMTGINNANKADAEVWLKSMNAVLLDNLRIAEKTCTPKKFECADKPMPLVRQIKQFDTSLPAKLQPWRAEAQRFYKTYAAQQLRLAVLFHKVTSEIFLLDDSELDGLRMADKTFSLTFDDGPTTKGGSTDKTVATLNKLGLSAHFFVVGEKFAWRNERQKDGKKLYTGQCMASHGFRHNSHAKSKEWSDSISKTQKLLAKIFGDKPYPFRPPYGQRHLKLTRQLNAAKQPVVLWNLDSQDWHQGVDAKGMAGRMIHLMAVWRRGILLFHDIHPKAQEALPIIQQSLAKADIQWVSCQQGFGDRVRDTTARVYP